MNDGVYHIQNASRRGPKDIWPLVVKNLSSEIAPPYAILQIVGCVRDADTGAAIYQVTKPTGDPNASYLINSPQAIAAGGHGQGTNTLPVPVLLGSTAGAAVGADFGAVADSWGISDAGDGFILVSSPIDGKAMVRHKAGGTSGTDHPIVKLRNIGQLLIPARSVLISATATFGSKLSGNDTSNLASFLARQVFLDVSLATGGGFGDATSALLDDPFCIALHDIEARGVNDPVDESPIGDGVCVGLVQVRINFTNATHTHAHLEKNLEGTNIRNDRLVSDTKGRAEIVWREKQTTDGAGTLGPQWAIVLLDNAPAAEDSSIAVCKFSTMPAANTGSPGVGEILTAGLKSLLSDDDPAVAQFPSQVEMTPAFGINLTRHRFTHEQWRSCTLVGKLTAHDSRVNGERELDCYLIGGQLDLISANNYSEDGKQILTHSSSGVADWANLACTEVVTDVQCVNGSIVGTTSGVVTISIAGVCQ
jgi:hypothetical protein